MQFLPITLLVVHAKYLLDILILGLLVLLFGSIYLTRPTPRLRYWIIGWLFVLAHFASCSSTRQPITKRPRRLRRA